MKALPSKAECSQECGPGVYILFYSPGAAINFETQLIVCFNVCGFVRLWHWSGGWPAADTQSYVFRVRLKSACIKSAHAYWLQLSRALTSFPPEEIFFFPEAFWIPLLFYTWLGFAVIPCVLVKTWIPQNTSHSNRDVVKRVCVLTGFRVQLVQKIPKCAQTPKGPTVSPWFVFLV